MQTTRRQLNYLHCLHLSFVVASPVSRVAIFIVIVVIVVVAAAVLVLVFRRSMVCEIHLVCGGINFMAKICFPFGS